MSSVIAHPCRPSRSLPLSSSQSWLLRPGYLSPKRALSVKYIHTFNLGEIAISKTGNWELRSKTSDSDSYVFWGSLAMDTDSPAKGAENAASSSTSSLGAAVPSQMERNNSQSSTHKPSHIAAHRQSFAENQRYPPPSPRNQRHPSLTQQAVLELMNHPPSNRHPNPRYAGRDWRDITVGELAVPEDVRWAELDLSVQDATMVRLSFPLCHVRLVAEWTRWLAPP